MNSTEWLSVVSEAYKLKGKELTPEKELLLLSSQEKDENLYSEVKDLILNSFFKKVSQRGAFGPVEKIKERLGRTLEESYKLTECTYLNIARAYWTYHIELDDFMAEAVSKGRSVLHLVLQEINEEIKTKFISPSTTSDYEQIRLQKEMIQEFLPGLDTSDLETKNPTIFNLESARQSAFESSQKRKPLIWLIFGTISLTLAVILFFAVRYFVAHLFSKQ